MNATTVAVLALSAVGVVIFLELRAARTDAAKYTAEFRPFTDGPVANLLKNIL